jgi:hypothetical protein
MQQQTRRRVLQSAGGLGSLVLLGGTGVASVAADDDGDAKVRVAHASPDAPAVDVFVEGAKVLAAVPFGTVSSYLEIAAGTYEVAIAAASDADSPGDAPVVVFQGDLTLDAEDYTVAAIGELSPEGDEPGFSVDVFTDKLGVLDGGTGRVRVYHAVPDAPPVDVWVVDGNAEKVLPITTGLAFSQASDNVEVPAGDYRVAVYPAGSDAIVAGPYDVTVRDGEVLTVFAEGNLVPEGDEPPFQPVLAYEEAAPFGRGPGGGGPPGRGGRGRGPGGP